MKLSIAFILSLLFASQCHASIVHLEWDANTEEDLSGYVLFSSTFSFLDASTATVFNDSRIKKMAISFPTVTTATDTFKAGTTYYYRLTAFDTSANQSGFNVDASSNPHEVVVYITPGDVNLDGLVNIFDASLLIEAWESAKPEADFDNSGKVDIFDASNMIDNWSP